jgi:GNAT superfamily N-acetyltransferase
MHPGIDQSAVEAARKMVENNKTDQEIRLMTPQDIPDGLRLCRLAHWNQLEADWRELLALSPQGGRVALNQGAIVGSVVTLDFSHRFAWVGMLLVDPAVRGMGIGSDLFKASLEVFPDVDVIRLDATPQGRPVYQRFGFQDEFGLMRMQGTGARSLDSKPSSLVEPIPDPLPPDVLDWDLEVFGADRSPLLRWAQGQAPEYSWVVRDGAELLGYCFGRHGYNYEQVGPLVTDRIEVAWQLLQACLKQQSTKPFILDVPVHQQDWRKWLAESGFSDQRPFTRMSRGENRYPGHPANLYAMLGPEFA